MLIWPSPRLRGLKLVLQYAVPGNKMKMANRKMKCELVFQIRFQDPVLLAKLANFKVEWSNH